MLSLRTLEMISNPSRGILPDPGCKGGLGLYHFSPYDNGLTGSKGNNLILFAKSFEDAVQRYKEVFETILEREEGRSFDFIDKSFHHDIVSENTKNRMKAYLRILTVDTVSYVAATHPFIVGWATNDVIM